MSESMPAAAPEPTPYSAAPAGGAPKKAPVLSIIALIAGILGLLGSWIGIFSILGLIGVILPIAAIILGFLGKSKEPQASKGLWLTGIITGFIGLAITVLLVIGSTVLFASLGEQYNDMTPYELEQQLEELNN
ncbi:DUF4190 domain-containing protein [Salinibacterium sp. dk2585]|uniref:DUF4190 domain-containing protein n=1 Tax=unclassified Salinibacterium TaxID=2632331 RepID=UPI0011C24DE5|nr:MULTISPECIES: DUF4190 domain-containing protein [unclassified Salinibacterium]QEE60654.1 DUF4190 domain-containing protein [Salinibacterium sp. dk2585]TXK55726.1 DUF4190 domain-containing protein [Salinibacterium sp. dk5596]